MYNDRCNASNLAYFLLNDVITIGKHPTTEVPNKLFILYIYGILLRNKQFYENRLLFD
ncbi:hypothetical protein SPHINGO8BC_60726 [Sphingobacterium multivorum]|uniref:Uncharacterized protein n=1 Tax=Sphingobacterium multivorum TaxID=28454 RepID=A0A654DIP8_SPHMU|nr:hypothetical protein SPHINGO8BC_60726 [Sphingobacterium multivorum]